MSTLEAAPDVTLQAAREAAARRAWRETHELFTRAGAPGDLSAEDLELFADAAWWMGRIPECMEARERAYAKHVAAGNRVRAAWCALWQHRDHEHRLNDAEAAGWFARAERLLDAEPEAPEHGWLERERARRAIGSGDLDAGYAHATRTLEIGDRFGDRDLQALGLHEQGRVLVARGDVEKGIALLDEATVAAVSGELNPIATAIIYCNVITTFRDLGDYGRAGDWTDAAKRWCERQAITGFPGMCRVFRAEIMRLRGAWAEAGEEALRATDELRDFAPDVAGSALAELGEIRLRLGDFAGAEEAFGQAHQLGCVPEPGMTMLRLAQGKVEAATSTIRRALADDTLPPLGRARLLPAQVDVAIAAGDVETARRAAEELGAICAAYKTSSLGAVSATARGAVLLAEGDAPGALKLLRGAVRLWRDADVPHEEARARVLLARAYRADGDPEAARLELGTAKAAFDRLGAVPDVLQVIALLEEPPAEGGQRAVRTFMFSDIVRSTNLLEAIGDEAWEDLLRWHDQALRACFARHGGQEAHHTGDGFFVAFPEARGAIECAVDIQRRLADHRRTHGFAPQVRIGLHAAEATVRGNDFAGKGVHEAARIGALAEGGEILASRETAEACRDLFTLSEARAVPLKGISTPVEVVSVDWR